MASSLFATKSTQTALKRADDLRSATKSRAAAKVPSKALTTAVERSQENFVHRQQCLYRMGAGATMFEVKDPDPYAVDQGRILGVRMEVFVSGELNQSYGYRHY